MPLLRLILKANRCFIQTFTRFFYVLGCVAVAFYGASALASEPVQFKPEMPLWEAKVFLWFGAIAVWSLVVDLAEQAVTRVIEKTKARREKNAIY